MPKRNRKTVPLWDGELDIPLLQCKYTNLYENNVF